MTADPQEQHNLAADPRFAATLKELRARTAEWRRKQGDAETGPENLDDPNRREGVSPYVF